MRQCLVLLIEVAPVPEETQKEEKQPVNDQVANRKRRIGRLCIEEMEALKEGWSDVGSEQNAIEGEGEIVVSVRS